MWNSQSLGAPHTHTQTRDGLERVFHSERRSTNLEKPRISLSLSLSLSLGLAGSFKGRVQAGRAVCCHHCVCVVIVVVVVIVQTHSSRVDNMQNFLHLSLIHRVVVALDPEPTVSTHSTERPQALVVLFFSFVPLLQRIFRHTSSSISLSLSHFGSGRLLYLVVYKGHVLIMLALLCIFFF